MIYEVNVGSQSAIVCHIGDAESLKATLKQKAKAALLDYEGRIGNISAEYDNLFAAMEGEIAKKIGTGQDVPSILQWADSTYGPSLRRLGDDLTKAEEAAFFSIHDASFDCRVMFNDDEFVEPVIQACVVH